MASDTSNRTRRSGASGSSGRGAFYHLTAGKDLEVFLTRQLTHDLNRKVALGGEARQPATVMDSVGEEVLQPGPMLANGGDNTFRPSGVLHVDRG